MRYNDKRVIERERIGLKISSSENIYEMHRNVRVELYCADIANSIKNSIDFSRLARYPDIDEFISILARFEDVDDSNILISSGIDGALKTIFEMCTRPGDKIVYLAPTYAMYKVYSEAYEVNASFVYPKTDTLLVDFDEILEAINKDVQVIFIQNPHLPIESCQSISNLEKIVQKALLNETLVVIDEAYYMFGSDSASQLIKKYENIVVMRTFSKGFGLPAIRLGFIMADEEMIKYLSSRRVAHETNYLSLQVATWALNNIGTVNKYNNEIAWSRDWFSGEIRKLGFRVHGKITNTISIIFDRPEDADRLGEHLRQNGFYVKSKIAAPFENVVLITVGLKETMELLLESIKDGLNVVR